MVCAMLVAIKFNNKFGAMAGEVRNIRSDGRLFAEMQASLLEFA